MTNQPLSSNDLTKIVIFILLMLPSIFLVVGIIPALFLAFGIFMMKKSKDFSHIETASRNYKYYVLILLIGSVLLILGSAISDIHSNKLLAEQDHGPTAADIEMAAKLRGFEEDAPEYLRSPVISFDQAYMEDVSKDIFFIYLGTALLAIIISILHIFLMKKLFLSPLKAHADWVVENGIFSGHNGVNNESLDIIKSEGLRSFSVADELIKWAKLKEDGHITEQEFDDVRKKLLQKN